MASNINGYRFPGLNDSANVPNDLQALASDVNRKLARTFPTAAARNAAAGAVAGDRSYTAGDKSAASYDGSAWVGSDSSPAANNVAWGWSLGALGASWANYGQGWETVQYCRVNGVVWMKGLIASGSSSVIIFTMPAGFRPATRLGFTQPAAGGIARVDVESSGVVSVQAYSSGGTNGYVGMWLHYTADA